MCASKLKLFLLQLSVLCNALAVTKAPLRARKQPKHTSFQYILYEV
jgi:hypothetical protein